MKRIVGVAIATVGIALVSGCGANPPPFLGGADDFAPAKYDQELERLNAGRATCLQHQDGKSDRQIVESVVFWADPQRSGNRSEQGVSLAEAEQFVPYALRFCDYLLSPEVKARLGDR